MVFEGQTGALIGKETTEDIEGAISKKSKCPRDFVDVGFSPISKKPKYPEEDVGGPSFSGVANVPGRIEAAVATASAAAAGKWSLSLLAEFLYLRSITEKHIQEIESDKDENEISRTQGLLVKIEAKIDAICRRLVDRKLQRVSTVPEAHALHFLKSSDHNWVGKALTFAEEMSPEQLMLVTKTLADLEVTEHYHVKDNRV